LEDYKLIIELDGIQHFEQISNWESPEENLKETSIKWNVRIKMVIQLLEFFRRMLGR